MTELEDLPDELLEMVFSFLDAKTLYTIIPIVCHDWNTIGKSERIWKSLFLRTFPLESTSHLDVNRETNCWRKVFREFHDALDNSVIFLPFNEGRGEPENISFVKNKLKSKNTLNAKDETNSLSDERKTDDEMMLDPFLIGRAGTWEDLWTTTEVTIDGTSSPETNANSEKHASDNTNLDAPHQRYCLRFNSKRRDSLLIVVRDVRFMISQSFTFFLKIKFDHLNRQQNFFSIWREDYKRVAGELHRGGELGFYTTMERTRGMSNVTVKQPNQWTSLCFTYHKGELQIFVNGVIEVVHDLKSEEFSMLDGIKTDQRFYLGSDRNEAYWTDCQMTSVILYPFKIDEKTLNTLRKL